LTVNPDKEPIMQSHFDGLEDIAARLLKLERQNRRFKQLGVAVLIASTSLIAMGQAPSKKIIEANEFILRDDSGKVRARLSMTVPEGAATGFPSVAQLTLSDEKGKNRVAVSGGTSSETLSFVQREPRSGVPGFSVFDEQGRARGYFIETNGDGSSVQLLDAKGNAPIRLGLGEVNADSVAAGRVLADSVAAGRVLADSVATGRVLVHDNGGNLRARLFVTEKTTTTLLGMAEPMTLSPEALLAFYDEKGQPQVLFDHSNLVIESGGHPSVMLGNGTLSLRGNGESTFALLSPYNISLSDQDGFSATIGLTNLVTSRTGETHKTTAASLVMFDKNKNVIWKAP
jgi:hypothetical protein